ncbi:hypothetical protein GGI1_18446, partial [Acidithiobacillus sp. GGI-221]
KIADKTGGSIMSDETRVAGSMFAVFGIIWTWAITGSGGRG